MLHIKAPKNKKGIYKKNSFTLEISSVQNIHIVLASNSRAIHSATTDSWAAGEQGDGTSIPYTLSGHGIAYIMLPQTSC